MQENFNLFLSNPLRLVRHPFLRGFLLRAPMLFNGSHIFFIIVTFIYSILKKKTLFPLSILLLNRHPQARAKRIS
jgi:hypothetical protein